jgi:hypothetical protein
MPRAKSFFIRAVGILVALTACVPTTSSGATLSVELCLRSDNALLNPAFLATPPAWRSWPRSLAARNRRYSKKKGTGAPVARSPTRLYSNYPLVTTGGGALPFPMYCAQPAMLRSASTTAIPRESLFIGVVPLS